MNTKYEELLTDESFQRWLSHTASAQEYKKWATWLKADSSHQAIFEKAELVWESIQFSTEPIPDIELEWSRLQDRLNLKTQKCITMKSYFSKKGIAQLSANFSNVWHKGGAWPRYTALATAMFIVLLTWRFLPLLTNLSEQAVQTIFTQFGERERVMLSDGTKIILNANSRFRFQKMVESSGAFQVELLGEAYFDVTPGGKDFQQPRFLIETADGIVQVIGTKFTVHYRGEGTTVVVEQGSVRILVSGSHKNPGEVENNAVVLSQGNLLKFNKGDKILNPKMTNVAVHTSWWTEQLIFDNTPISIIVKRLEETYNVNIEMQNPQLLQQCISGSIENGDLQIIIIALAKIMQCTIQKQNDTIVFIKN